MRHAVREWLSRSRVTDTPEGDLIADMRADKDIPRLFSNIDEMRSYLLSKGAGHGALSAVPAVWRRYRSWLDRNPCKRTA